MAKRTDTIGTAVLFTAAICGIALASSLYLSLSPKYLSDLWEKTPQSLSEFAFYIQGTLASLTLVFLSGFLSLPLPFHACLVTLRICKLTLACYLAFSACGAWRFLYEVLLAGILAVLFLAFSRLSYLFGIRRKTGKKRKRHVAQFTFDYLFFCGLCSILRISAHLAAFIQIFTEKGC